MELDNQPNYYKPQKFNKGYVGLILGLIFPAVCFVIYYYLKTVGDISLVYYYQMLLERGAFVSVLSLCVLPNLLLFFLFKKLDYWYSIQGVIFAIFVYTMVVLVLKFS